MKMKKAIAGLCAGVVAISAMATTGVFAEDAATSGTVTEIDLTRPYLEWTWGGEYEVKAHMATKGFSGTGAQPITFNFGKQTGTANDYCMPGMDWEKGNAALTLAKDSTKLEVKAALSFDLNGNLIATYTPNLTDVSRFGKVGEKFNTSAATGTDRYISGNGFSAPIGSVLDEYYINSFKIGIQQVAKIKTWKFWEIMNGECIGLVAKSTRLKNAKGEETGEVTFPTDLNAAGLRAKSNNSIAINNTTSAYLNNATGLDGAGYFNVWGGGYWGGADTITGLVKLNPIEDPASTGNAPDVTTTEIKNVVQYTPVTAGYVTKFADKPTDATLFVQPATPMMDPNDPTKILTVQELVTTTTPGAALPGQKRIDADNSGWNITANAVNSKEEKVSYFVTYPDQISEMNSSNQWMNAFRIMNDCIADNQGVTITLVAKDAFNELLWNVNSNMVDWKTLPGAANTVFTDNTVYASQGTGYYDPLNNWGSSLYLGGMMINNNLSRQFSDVDVFDWGTNTLTFDWDGLTEGRILDASVNVFRYGFITGTKVEWAKIQITVPAQEAVDVAPEAPITVEEETTAAPAETAAPVVTAAPVANPTTGNAPIALAVIPVALAAAAIVAKKSK